MALTGIGSDISVAGKQPGLHDAGGGNDDAVRRVAVEVPGRRVLSSAMAGVNGASDSPGMASASSTHWMQLV